MAIAHPSLWRPNTAQWVIAEALVAEDLNRKRAFARHIRPVVGTEPLVFKGKTPTGYGPLEHDDQCRRAWYRTGDVLKAIQEHGWDKAAGEAAAAAEASEEAPVAPVAEPVVSGFDPKAEMRFFVSEVRRLREWIADHDPELDHLSYRPVKDGRKMIDAGIPAVACLYAMTCHWDAQTRVMAGVKDYDPATDFAGGLHAYLDALVKARVHIFLHGEAGFGKSYWAEAMAERMDLPFGQIPCNEGVSPSWVLGKDTVSGYKTSKFAQIFSERGVFLFDEIDRMDSNMAVLLNGPLANGTLDNPITGEDVAQHEDCILVFAGNSLGYGSHKYLSANELDPSTLDRLRMGRAHVGYDRNVEDLIAFG